MFKPFLADYYEVDARAQLHSGDICQFVLLMLRSRFAGFRQATGSQVNLILIEKARNSLLKLIHSNSFFF